MSDRRADLAPTADARLVDRADVDRWVPRRPSDAHKWQFAVKVIAGSPSMPGAARIVSLAALRGGAGIVHLWSPSGMLDGLPTEVVQADTDVRRFGSVVVGPGLGRDDHAVAVVGAAIGTAAPDRRPLVLDGDALWAVALGTAGLHRDLGPHVVLTPHAGEFEFLMGGPPGVDRLGAVRAAADRFDCVVVLKGPITLVAGPDGRAYAVNAGDQRLATAGSGDVLAGLLGALLSRGVGSLEAAAAAAFVHGVAGSLCAEEGTIASDIVAALPAAWATVRGSGR